MSDTISICGVDIEQLLPLIEELKQVAIPFVRRANEEEVIAFALDESVIDMASLSIKEFILLSEIIPHFESQERMIKLLGEIYDQCKFIIVNWTSTDQNVHLNEAARDRLAESTSEFMLLMLT